LPNFGVADCSDDFWFGCHGGDIKPDRLE
jgi:hypothetical protein